MQAPPTPPVDPANEEFVLFIRAKKFPQWYPLSVVKGGAQANVLLKAMQNDFGKLLYGKTLIRNIGSVSWLSLYTHRRAYPGQCLQSEVCITYTNPLLVMLCPAKMYFLVLSTAPTRAEPAARLCPIADCERNIWQLKDLLTLITYTHGWPAADAGGLPGQRQYRVDGEEELAHDEELHRF